jgi:hypothetical protein
MRRVTICVAAQVLGQQFFTPPHMMRLLECVRGRHTSDDDDNHLGDDHNEDEDDDDGDDDLSSSSRAGFDQSVWRAQVLGQHFFTPPQVMRLVECVRGRHTSDDDHSHHGDDHNEDEDDDDDDDDFPHLEARS